MKNFDRLTIYPDGTVEGAPKWLNVKKEYDRRNYRALRRLAEVYNDMSKHEMAKKYAKDCIRLKRNYFPAHYELGVAEKGLGNKLAAISAFKMAKKSSTWRPSAQYEIDQIQKELD